MLYGAIRERQRVVAAANCYDGEATTIAISELYPELKIEVNFSSTNAPSPAVILTSFRGRAQLHFTLYNDMPESVRHLIINRWLDTVPLLLTFSSETECTGSCYLSVGDEGHALGLTYCENRPGFFLIPDCIFLSHTGYAEAREFESESPPWQNRKSVAFWRGSSTGYPTPNIIDRPRVKLCMLAADLDNSSLIDAKLTQLVQISEIEKETLRSMKLTAEYSPIRDMLCYKYQIDIDGNTNSWPGLLYKLHSGSLVIKIASPRRYRQWYYDRLISGSTIIEAKSDLSDLIDILRYVALHDDEVRQIGERGRQLALSLNYENEVRASFHTIEQAMDAFGQGV